MAFRIIEQSDTGLIYCDPGSGVQTQFFPGGGLNPSGLWLPFSLDSNGSLYVNSGSPVPPASSTLTVVAASTSSVQVLAANGLRQGAIIYNNSSSVCYLAFASSASSGLFTEFLEPGSTFSMDPPIYQGVISAIWASAIGQLQVTEFA
jgi:hypothetical protein